MKKKTSFKLQASSLKKHDLMQCDACGGTEFRFLFDHHHNWKVQSCVACGFSQVIPRPTKKEVAALYTEDMEHFAPYIEQLSVHQAYFQKELGEIVKEISPKPPPVGGKHAAGYKSPTNKLKLLDIGCAMGVLLSVAKEQGIVAEGIDLSKDAVDYCNSHELKTYYGTLADFYTKNSKKKYDIITAFEIIEHEYSPRIMVETIYTMLKPHGIAIITTPNHGSIWRKVMGKYWPGYQHKEHLFFFDEQSLFNMGMSAGFSHVTVKHDVDRPFPLSFLFTRAGDYFPPFAPLLRFIGKAIEPLHLTNPINPWDDLIVIGKK